MNQQSHYWAYTLRNQYEGMHHDVHSSTIHNSQDMEVTQVSINRWMDKDDVVYVYNEILLSHKKE